MRMASTLIRSTVFPAWARSKGQSLAGSAHWENDAIIATVFPLEAARFSRSASFFVFAAMTAMKFFVVLFLCPETKGITLEQLQLEEPGDA